MLSSRVRLARNIRGFTFPPYADAETRENVVHFVQSAIDKSKELETGDFVRSDDVTEMHRAFLIERHLISPEFMRDQNASGLYISPDEKIAIMVNEEDHVRIQSMSSGLSLMDTLNRAMRIDDDLAHSLEFDYDTDFGFLTSCPTNVGTGLRASILIHLAGLVLTKEIDSVIDHINKLGLVVRGFYGEGTDVWGNLFQISNQTTLGRSEFDITESLEKITRQIIEFENKARDRLLTEAARRNRGQNLESVRYSQACARINFRRGNESFERCASGSGFEDTRHGVDCDSEQAVDSEPTGAFAEIYGRRIEPWRPGHCPRQTGQRYSGRTTIGDLNLRRDR